MRPNSNPLRVINLQASNFKRLSAIDITPDGDVVVIGGKNGQGKTSVLDAIWLALGGAKAPKPAQPIRTGEDTAFVRLDLGDLVVTRKWARDKASTLTVENADGAKYSSPQAMLDSLIGRLSFDPLAFSLLPQKDQLTQLLDMVELPFDPKAIQAKRDEWFRERTELNRAAMKTKAALEQYTEPGEELPDAEVTSRDLLDEIRRVEQANGAKEAARAHVSRCADRVSLSLDALDRAQKDYASAQAEHVAAAEGFHELPEIRDTAALNRRLDDIGRINDLVRARNAHRSTAEFLVSVQNKAEAFTEKIAQLDARKAAELSQAKFPVEGLGFDEDGVTFNGIPFRQCSAAERLRVSVGMAMSANPSIRVIRIEDASLLDDDNLMLIADMATDNDYQVWIERVGDPGDVGILIEDGSVAAVDGVRA